MKPVLHTLRNTWHSPDLLEEWRPIQGAEHVPVGHIGILSIFGALLVRGSRWRCALVDHYLKS